MYFSNEDIQEFIEENDVKFIRLSFCDTFGNMKNIAIMPNELERAIEYGIPFMAKGLLEPEAQELMLRPDTSSLSVLPWRPQAGRVIRFFCRMYDMQGNPYEGDARRSLRRTMKKLSDMQYTCNLSTRCEFYLFRTDMQGNPTRIPCDNGGYLDIAPLDQCEDTRREICLALEEMGVKPTSSCHKSGPGQNEIDFAASNPLKAADHMMHYKTVVRTIAARNGLYATFMPKPLPDKIGSALKINIMLSKNGSSIFGQSKEEITPEGYAFLSGIINRISTITAFMNPTVNSYERFSAKSMSRNNCILKMQYIPGFDPSVQICSADAFCNPYLTFQLLLQAGLEGIENHEHCSLEQLRMTFSELPLSLKDAVEKAAASAFVQENLAESTMQNFLIQQRQQITAYETAENTQDYCYRKFF